MRQTPIFKNLLALFLVLIVTPRIYADELHITTSIRPLYFIATTIMRGTGQPDLLLTQQQSPHHYHLQPSQLRQLNKADSIFWIGPSLESTLAKPIGNLAQSIYSKPLLEIPDLHLMQFSGVENGGEKHADHGSINPHIWLHSQNIVLIAENITALLASHDQDNSSLYHANLNRLIEDITALENEIKISLQHITNSKILALHDAWTYFAESYHLKAYTAIEADGLEQLGAKSFYKLKKQIQSGLYDCVIYGPETNQKRLRELAANSQVRLILLDPMANDLPLNGSFVDYLKAVTKKLSACRADTKRAGKTGP